MPVEHGMDATYNISAWMDKFLIAPFVPPYVKELATTEAPAEENKEQEQQAQQ